MASLFILCLFCVVGIFFSCLFYVVSSNASDCLEKLVSKVTYYVTLWYSNGSDNAGDVDG